VGDPNSSPEIPARHETTIDRGNAAGFKWSAESTYAEGHARRSAQLRSVLKAAGHGVSRQPMRNFSRAGAVRQGIRVALSDNFVVDLRSIVICAPGRSVHALSSARMRSHPCSSWVAPNVSILLLARGEERQR